MIRKVLSAQIVLCTMLMVIFLSGLDKTQLYAQQAHNTTSSFLFISDVHLNPNDSATQNGQDAGMDLWKAFRTKINEVMAMPGAPRFILYTGDLPVHNGWCNTLTGSGAAIHDKAIAIVLNELRALSVKYKKPVFYLPGNNDALGGDYLPFSNKAGKTPLSMVMAAPMFFPKNSAPAGSPAHIISNHQGKGYYSAQVFPGLRLIALNTVIFNSSCPDTGRPYECAQEMLWLRAQLQDAANNGDKAYIAMHIPPGFDYNCNPMWNNFGGNWVDTFLQLTAVYSNTISGVFYGHTHMDEVRRLYSPAADTVTKVAICCPGISAQHWNNPGFKVVEYDTDTKEPLDFTTYYTTLPLTNGVWSGGSYTFAREFSNKPGVTIYNCLRNISSATLAADVDSIYNVQNQPPAGMNHITCEVDVKP